MMKDMIVSTIWNSKRPWPSNNSLKKDEKKMPTGLVCIYCCRTILSDIEGFV